MSVRNLTVSVAALLVLAALVPQETKAQNSTNPYAIVEGWAKLPKGGVMLLETCKGLRNGGIGTQLLAATLGDWGGH